jgi:AbrB family looped-hinge helix DNA binding protein
MALPESMVHMGPQGRLVIPAELRRALRLEPGETLVIRVEDDRLVLERPLAALARLQRAFSEAVPAGVSLADELIRDRRAEAERDSAG